MLNMWLPIEHIIKYQIKEGLKGAWLQTAPPPSLKLPSHCFFVCILAKLVCSMLEGICYHLSFTEGHKFISPHKFCYAKPVTVLVYTYMYEGKQVV